MQTVLKKIRRYFNIKLLLNENVYYISATRYLNLPYFLFNYE